MLEIVNCLVASNLTANPELVYALLHRQEELQPLLVGSGRRLHDTLERFGGLMLFWLAFLI